MSRRILPPLVDRRTRVRLLAWSYEDAAFGSDDGGRGSRPQSRIPGRNPELWEAGSYRDLERAMDALREKNVFEFRLFWALFVKGRFQDQQPGGMVERVAGLMPQQLFVPAVICEAAGYLPSEARLWERRRLIAA